MPIFNSRRPMKKKPAGAGKNNNQAKNKNRPPKRDNKRPLPRQQNADIESTGMESLYLKELIESETMVVVVMTTGEKLRGWIRYYDRDVFSVGPADGSPKVFVRKSGVRYLYEE